MAGRFVSTVANLFRKISFIHVLFAVLLVIFLTNTFHEEYPDEFDSIVGGLYITQGRLPYRDWFQHHQPLAYIVASVIIPFSGQSFVRFRIALALVFFALNTLGYIVLRLRVGQRNRTPYLLYLFLVALGGTYFWGQMLLADTLAAYLLIPAYVLLVYKSYYHERFEMVDLALVGAFLFLTWFTSMTYTFVISGLSLYVFYCTVRDHWETVKGRWRCIVTAGSILVLPYILFLVYLVATGSLRDYYFANITYNQNYYVYNYPRPPGAPVNPIRYAIIIANTFVNNYIPALSGLSGFPLGDPLQVTLAFSSAAFFVLLLLRRRFSLLVPFLIVLIYSNARSNPQQIRETDYQAAMYILISVFHGLFTVIALREYIDRKKMAQTSKLVAATLFLFLCVYWSFSYVYIGLKFVHKFYPKYMGQAPLIYDEPRIAPMLNRLIQDKDYVWIGPFEFEELFYLKKGNIPSKYHWFLQHAATSKIKDEMIADFQKHRPKIIVFNRLYSPWGGDPKGFNYFFTDFLDQGYFRIYKLNEELTDYQYRWKVENPRNFDIDGDFNFDRDRKDEILRELLEAGYIERVDKAVKSS